MKRLCENALYDTDEPRKKSDAKVYSCRSDHKPQAKQNAAAAKSHNAGRNRVADCRDEQDESKNARNGKCRGRRGNRETCKRHCERECKYNRAHYGNDGEPDWKCNDKQNQFEHRNKTCCPSFGACGQRPCFYNNRQGRFCTWEIVASLEKADKANNLCVYLTIDKPIF